MNIALQDAIVDALPYIDTGYEEPGVREAAIAMVEEEKKQYRPTKNYIEHIPPINESAFVTELMKKEFERISSRLPGDTLSMKRYELPPPPPGKMTDVTAWAECVDNSYAQLEHQAIRLMNLELLQENGAEAWKAHNEVLSGMLARTQAEVARLKKSIQEVNYARKNKQVKAGEELRHLESTWVSLVSRNLEIEQACQELAERCDALRRKGEQAS